MSFCRNWGGESHPRNYSVSNYCSLIVFLTVSFSKQFKRILRFTAVFLKAEQRLIYFNIALFLNQLFIRL